MMRGDCCEELLGTGCELSRIYILFSFYQYLFIVGTKHTKDI